MSKSTISETNFSANPENVFSSDARLGNRVADDTYPLERNAPVGVEPKYFIGIDLHSNNIVYCVLKQENGQPKKIKSGKVSCNNTAGIAAVGEALRPYCENVPHFAVVEATYNWYWLANLFESEGWFLRLADPCTVSQANLKYSNDHTDAAYLAERLRVHSLKTFPIMGQAYRDLRDLSRSLMVLKQDMARLKITVVNELVNHCSVRVRIDSLIRDPLKLVRGNEKKPGVYEKLDELLSKIVHEFVQLPGTHYMLCSQLRRIVRLTLEVEKLGELLFGKMTDSPTTQALKTIKGCGPVLSTIIATEVGDIRRFASAKNFQSYCRLAPTSKLSNGKSKGQGNAKNGSAYLSWALTELATLMARFNPEVGAEFQRLLARAGGLRVKAIRALAAKISRAIFHMLRNGEVFDVKRCFAPRKTEAK